MVTCLVSKGDFPFIIRWTLNNKTLDQLDGISTINPNKRASQLTIESVTADHSGKYTCAVKNKAGFDEYSAYLNVNGILFFIFSINFFYPVSMPFENVFPASQLFLKYVCLIFFLMK